MPKTYEEIYVEYADNNVSSRKDKDYIKEFDKFANQICYSEQEIKDKLKKAEKRIDAITMKQILELALNKPKESALKILVKQILNDCFGAGK